MRHLIIYIALTAALLASCENDTYDKGEGAYSYLQADFVEAHANGEKEIDYVITDNGDSLSLVTPCVAAWAKTADSTYRAALYYDKVEGGKAKAVIIEQMLTMSITPADSIKEMKTDPIGVEAVWTDSRKRYVNLTLTLKVGTVSNDSEKHKVTLVPDSPHFNSHDTSRTLHLTLYHDKGDIPEYYTEKYYFSLPSAHFSALNADSVAIHANTTASGMKTLTVSLRR